MQFNVTEIESDLSFVESPVKVKQPPKKRGPKPGYSKKPIYDLPVDETTHRSNLSWADIEQIRKEAYDKGLAAGLRNFSISSNSK